MKQVLEALAGARGAQVCLCRHAVSLTNVRCMAQLTLSSTCAQDDIAALADTIKQNTQKLFFSRKPASS